MIVIAGFLPASDHDNGICKLAGKRERRVFLPSRRVSSLCIVYIHQLTLIHHDSLPSYRYFQSRPEIFAASSANSQDVSGVAASAVHRAMANNPEATAKIVSAGLRHAAGQTKPPGGAGAGGANVSRPPHLTCKIIQSDPSKASSENDMSSVAGRVAAASMAFSNRHHPPPSSSSTSPPPIAEKPSPFSSVRVCCHLIHLLIVGLDLRV